MPTTKNNGPPLPSVLAPPRGLDARTFRVGSDEYVVMTFDVLPSREGLDLGRLTPSERSVASLVARGQSNSAIARARGTSPRTIANQVATIYRKLGVASRRELRVRAGGGERAL